MGHLDVDAKIVYLTDYTTQLGEDQKVYELSVKGTEEERIELQKLIRAERQVSINAIRMLESTYRMAGYNEEANRLRYLIRRASRKPKTEEVEGSETTENPAAEETLQDGEAPPSLPDASGPILV